jgi:hypothetical protein
MVVLVDVRTRIDACIPILLNHLLAISSPTQSILDQNLAILSTKKQTKRAVSS